MALDQTEINFKNQTSPTDFASVNVYPSRCIQIIIDTKIIILLKGLVKLRNPSIAIVNKNRYCNGGKLERLLNQVGHATWRALFIDINRLQCQSSNLKYIIIQ